MKTFWGKVKKGAQRGKDLGFPTANTSVHFQIEEGIYLSRVSYSSSERSESRSEILKQVQDDKMESSRQARTITHNALTFVGKAVTFGETQIKAESYILDFSGNLYGKYISVQLLKKLRDNKKFESAEELIKQMNEDLLAAREFFR